ncbi:MAG TPA: hypothetical protein VKG25_22160, partial [Bryobacteraceae bacterium]|nr:hypothetical protein [Bryobacteraceae bacterium]
MQRSLFGLSRGLLILGLSTAFSADTFAQDPVFRPRIEIDQKKLLTNCKVATAPGCYYKLKTVLESGGDFYTTPFQQYDPVTQTGDGYGEGPDGPRAAQRHAFNPSNPNYPFLRLNGLDSQSCFECHNSIGSSHQNYGEALMRKPYAAGGSAGSNSNAFINPLFPEPLTLFIRNPPIVFGVGYTQEIGDEMTTQLLYERRTARMRAEAQPSKPLTVPLVADGVNFGSFTTTFIPGSPAKVIADASSCSAGVSAPLNIGGMAGFTDDLTQLQGVACDLVIRPFQWKGVSSSVRHFARDALDFHFSMQAFEKVGYCDCDRDGKGSRATGTEVQIGDVTALVAFVTMMRPPFQEPLSKSAALGKDIFLGKLAGLPEKMCASCHVESHRVQQPFVLVEWPTNPNDEAAPDIDPDDPSTYPILESACPNGIPKTPNTCPMESSYSAAASAGALVTPARSSEQLPVVRRFNREVEAVNPATAGNLHTLLLTLRKPRNTGVVGQDYTIPLTPKPDEVTNLQLPRLKANPDGTIDAPIFSDLKTHNMGKFLSDPLLPLPAQGTDVAGIVTVPDRYLTRPIWGVADSGPWLH